MERCSTATGTNLEDRQIIPICHNMGSPSPEPLLSSCVPELQFDTNPRLHLQEVNIKVYTHRLVDGLQEQVFSVALQQGGFAHCGVPQHDDPELVLPQSQVHCFC